MQAIVCLPALPIAYLEGTQPGKRSTVSGIGGAGSSSADEDNDVDEPIALGPRIRKRRITVQWRCFCLPEIFFVSVLAPKVDVTRYICLHYASHPSWLSCTIESWIWRVSPRFPLASFGSWEFLVTVVNNVLGTRRALYLGHRATRKYGILVATFQSVEFVRNINAWLRAWLPRSFRWNALGLIRHANVAPHRDPYNSPESVAITLTPGRTYLEHYSPLLLHAVRTCMTRRPVWFNPNAIHAAVTRNIALTLVAYLTLRVPLAEHAAMLLDYGFSHITPDPVPPAQVHQSDYTSSEAGSSCIDETEPSAQAEHDRTTVDQIQPQSQEDRQISEPGQPQQQRFALAISPTLTFHESQHMRGGGPKARQTGPRVTWEGTSSADMLQIQSPLSARMLKAASSSIGRLGPTSRQPRHVTAVQLGQTVAKLEQTDADAQAPVPAAPIELVLEVDARGHTGGDCRALVKSFLSDAFLSNGAHYRMYSMRSQHEDPHILFSAKIRLNAEQAT
eukprot:6265471-Amphidinium_carterae.6